MRTIPTETLTFKYVNVNPKSKHTGDCVVRAIANACHISWEQATRELTEYAIKNNTVLNDKSCYEKYLKDKGWVKMPQPRHQDNTKYTLDQVAAFIDHPLMIASCANHLTIIRYGKIEDIWNCGFKACGNYWIRVK